MDTAPEDPPMKLRTLLSGTVLAVANLLLPVPQADAAPLAPHPLPAVAAPAPGTAHCFHAYHPMSPVVPASVVPAHHPC
ncbi:hypothetical protein GCM10010441_30560 [Kitasatospora paracochleata]